MGIRKIIFVILIVIAAVGIISFAATFSVENVQMDSEIPNEPKPQNIEPVSILEPQITPKIPEKEIPKYITKEKQCTGNARCISGFVTRVIDGDTITVDGQSIRFALVNTPEWGDFDYSQARAYIETICPVGSKVLVDEDDGQTQGSYGRIIGKIYCNELNLNEEILEVGHALILPEFCSVSEFAGDSWAQKHGC